MRLFAFLRLSNRRNLRVVLRTYGEGEQLLEWPDASPQVRKKTRNSDLKVRT
jgi:hypothetical protein